MVSGKPVTIDVPRGHRFHLSGASLALDAHPGRVVLSIRRRKPFGDEPPGTFPIAVLRAGRFESTYLDLFIAGGECVELHKTGSSAVSVIGSLVQVPHETAQGGTDQQWDGEEADQGIAPKAGHEIDMGGHEMDMGGRDSDSEDTQSDACSSEDMGLILPCMGHSVVQQKDSEAEQRNAAWASMAVEAAPQLLVGPGTKRCRGPTNGTDAAAELHKKRMKRK